MWFLASIWIYPGAPQLLWVIVSAGAVVPTVLVLRGLLDPRLLGILNILVVLYFVDQFRALIATLSVLYRVLYLAEMAGVIVYLAILARRMRRRADIANSRPWRVAYIAVWGAIFLFSITLILNVIGYCGLAIFLATPRSPVPIWLSSFMRAYGFCRACSYLVCARGR